MYVRLVGYSRIRILISQIKWHAHMTFTLSFEKGKKKKKKKRGELVYSMDSFGVDFG